MNKEKLIEILEQIKNGTYSWALYFFKIDRRNNNPYTAYKIRFKNDGYLLQYAYSLIDMIIKFQIGKISEVRKYTGENTKISCDMIETYNDLIEAQWEYLVSDIAEASDEKIKGKYHGYLLEGIPLNGSGKPVDFFRMANPVINLKNKRSAIFTFDSNSELSELSDEICKLHMSVDFIVLNEMIYSFNYKFEDLFNIEKTMKKVKERALDDIMGTEAFEDEEEFKRIAKSYKSPRTFITLKPDRVNRIKNENKRREVANVLQIDLSENGKFVFKDEKEVSRLLLYLCYKVFKDDETKELLEANNVKQLAI